MDLTTILFKDSCELYFSTERAASGENITKRVTARWH